MRISRFFPLLFAVVAGACNDTLGPTNWDATPDTVTLYSASRAELTGMASGFDLSVPRSVPVENVNVGASYDFVVTEANGSFALSPAGALTGTSNRAALATVSATALTDIRQAPSDTSAYKQLQPVPVKAGDFLVARSRRVNCVYTTGSYYAKLHVLAVDTMAGTLRFAFVRNPYCSNQALVPPGQ